MEKEKKKNRDASVRRTKRAHEGGHLSRASEPPIPGRDTQKKIDGP